MNKTLGFERLYIDKMQKYINDKCSIEVLSWLVENRKKLSNILHLLDKKDSYTDLKSKRSSLKFDLEKIKRCEHIKIRADYIMIDPSLIFRGSEKKKNLLLDLYSRFDECDINKEEKILKKNIEKIEKTKSKKDNPIVGGFLKVSYSKSFSMISSSSDANLLLSLLKKMKEETNILNIISLDSLCTRSNMEWHGFTNKINVFQRIGFLKIIMSTESRKVLIFDPRVCNKMSNRKHNLLLETFEILT